MGKWRALQPRTNRGFYLDHEEDRVGFLLELVGLDGFTLNTIAGFDSVIHVDDEARWFYLICGNEKKIPMFPRKWAR